MQMVIVSGLSGAGKTVALKQYEDLGYYCIDNIPLSLIGPLALRAIKKMEARYEHLAVGVDAREISTEIAKFPGYLDKLRARGVEIRVLFLQAREEVLLQRYAETRRRHPLSDDQTPLLEAIRREIRLLAPIAGAADAIVDTSGLNLHELRETILTQIPGGGHGKLLVQLMSFGFKHGTPVDADFVFDVRCLPNPYWDPALRKLDGRDPAVVVWLEKSAEVSRMVADIRQFLEHWLPEYRKQDRTYLTIAVGCTGGQHRSVYVIEKLADIFREKLDHLIVTHREIWIGQEHRAGKKKAGA